MLKIQNRGREAIQMLLIFFQNSFWLVKVLYNLFKPFKNIELTLKRY